MTRSKRLGEIFDQAPRQPDVVLAIGAGLPGPLMQLLANSATEQDRVLVVIQLSGGNDGLNTVVPYRDEAYRKARPKLGIAAAEVRKINDYIGFHPKARRCQSIDGKRSI